jgi:WD40 repeat protein
LASAGGNTGGSDEIMIWNVINGNLIMTLSGNTDDIYNSISFSPDGSKLASGSYYGMTNIWNVNDGSLLRTWTKQYYDVMSVFFFRMEVILLQRVLMGQSIFGT